MTLLGDAAHPMFPFFGQGAAQAIEDAATLARCLAAGRADPPAALRRYEGLRVTRTTRLQEVSHARAHVNHLPDGPEQRGPRRRRSPVPTRWRPAAGSTPMTPTTSR